MKNQKRKIISLMMIFVLAISTMMFNAQSVKADQTWTISFITNGGTLVADLTVTDNTFAEEPAKPTKDGYIFEDWYEDEELTTRFIFAGQRITENKTIYVKWIKVIPEVAIDVKLPDVGSEVTVEEYEQTPKATATVKVGDEYCNAWLINITTAASDDTAFEGTIEEGKEYNVELYLESKDSTKYVFTNDTAITVNGGNNYVKGAMYQNIDDWSPGMLLWGKVKAGASAEAEETAQATYTVLEGDGQLLSVGSPLTFRFDIPFETFTESGAVYVDDEAVDESMWTAENGSTILTFTDEFVSTLEAGEHTLKVAVADGEVTATFTIPEEAAKSKSIKAGDKIIVYAGVILIAIAGIVFARKNKKK